VLETLKLSVCQTNCIAKVDNGYCGIGFAKLNLQIEFGLCTKSNQQKIAKLNLSNLVRRESLSESVVGLDSRCLYWNKNGITFIQVDTRCGHLLS
jgi:hypothetical protein